MLASTVPPVQGAIDVVDEDLLAELNMDARVREAFNQAPKGHFGPGPNLNFSVITAAGVSARRVTQQVSRILFEDPRTPTGIRYISRHTEDEECWAIFDCEPPRASVVFTGGRVPHAHRP